jgi:glutamate-1-semialdehyde 2,1-aminomutase
MTHLVGGISSAARAVPAEDGQPFCISRAAGAYLWDSLGRRYIDTALGFGATLLGHGHPLVTEAVSAALASGPSPAFAHAREEEAAEALTEATGELSKVIFTSTGSEAVHLACRIARAVTGRSKIAKIAAGYDGWYDDVALGTAGSAEAEMRTNARPSRDRTTLIRFNDFSDVEALFAECNGIAAVLLEPMLANAGCIVPVPGYLAHVEAQARRHGALVILDEVLMGFRTRFGLAGPAMGITPDLSTVGKAIGSGIAVAAVIGTPETMEVCERGQVLRAGTYSGNPVSTAAVSATMKVLRELDYESLLFRGESLRSGIEHAFAAADMAVSTTGYGTAFTVWFDADGPTNYAAALRKVDEAMTRSLHLELRRLGVLVMPSAFGRIFISTEHNEKIINRTIEAFQAAALKLGLSSNA